MRLLIICLTLGSLTQTAWAHSASYHLERIALQARALQSSLMQLEEPTWGQKTAADDIRRLQATSESFTEALADKNLSSEDLSQYLVQLEVAAARVRTSRDIGGFDDQQLLKLDELQVEVKEVRRTVDAQRQQAQARSAQRNASRFSFGVGFGNPYFFGFPRYRAWYPRRVFYGNRYGRRCR